MLQRSPSSLGAQVSYHTAEWHAARIAALQVERLPFDEWKRKQKAEEAARHAMHLQPGTCTGAAALLQALRSIRACWPVLATCAASCAGSVHARCR